MTKEEKVDYDKQYYQTKIGRANRLRNTYIRFDRKYGRIGDELPKDYVTAEWIVDNIFTSKCVHSGESDWRKLGLNRLDNSKPHTIDNVEPCTKEWNVKLAGEYLTNREDLSKQVAQIDKLNGEVLAVYPSIMEAHRDTGVDQSSICSCCRGKRHTAGGYVWQYLN